MHYQSTDKSKPQTIPDTSDYYNNSMNSEVLGTTKLFAIIGYLTLFGWLIAIVLHDKYKSTFTTFHLRQSLGLIITGALLALVPLIGWLMNIAVFFLWLYAVYYASKGQQETVPFLGTFHQKHLDIIK